jgi:hypothetical protein
MDIKVNDADWNGLSPEDREKIQTIVKQIFKQDHQIVGDKDQVTASAEQLGSFCTFACDAAQTLAETACRALPNAPAQQVCLIAAKAAGDFCRSKC